MVNVVVVPPGTQKKRLSSKNTFVALVLLVVVTSLFYRWKNDWKIHSPRSGDWYSSASPIVQHEIIQEVDVLYAKPKDAFDAILFVAHGCSHSHTDWFLDCVGCVGLPEERAIVDISLQLNLMVVAISSVNRQSKCWNAFEDAPRIGRVLEELSQRYSHPPLYAFGASSGGSFVNQLGQSLHDQFGLKLAGFISQIAAYSLDPATPCQVYITMNRDPGTDERAQALVAANGDQKIRRRQIRLPPLVISEGFFSDRIPEISPAGSVELVRALRSAGMLDNEGHLNSNPRRSNWRETFQEAKVDLHQDSLIADQSPLSEVMNTAYGQHEMARDGVKEALEFCLGS